MTVLNMAEGSRVARGKKPRFKLEWYVPKDATTKRGWLYVIAKTPPWGSSAREELIRLGFRDSESKYGQMYKTLGHYLDYEKMGGRSGEQSVHAVSVATGQSRHFATPKQAEEWIESEARGIAKREGVALNFSLSTGVRARSRTAAHRRSRTRGHFGAAVNRAGRSHLYHTFAMMPVGGQFWFESEGGVYSKAAGGKLAWQGARGPWIKVSDRKYRHVDDVAGKFIYTVGKKSVRVSYQQP